MIVDPSTCEYVSEGAGYAEKVTNTFIEHIERGTAPWMRPWTPAPSFIPDYNPCTSGNKPQPYRGLNAAYLAVIRLDAGYDDRRWVTFNQAKTNGWSVRKGEKGHTISYFKWLEKDMGPRTDKQGKPIYGEDGKPDRLIKRVPMFQYYTVFNALQVEGMPPPPEHPEVERVFTPIEDAEKIISRSGAKIFYDQYNSAFYRPFSDSIHLPPKSAFIGEPAFYATALHELGHWTGHESRLNRDIINHFGTPLYAREELRAEIASYMLSEQIGIPFDPSNHAAYVASWLKMLKQDTKEILNAAHDAEMIMRYLVDGPREREVPAKHRETATALEEGR